MSPRLADSVCVLICHSLVILYEFIPVHADNTRAPHTGQVRTVDKGKLSSLLEIYNEEWRPLCVRNYQMNDFIANIICRQMGFTSSSQYRASK